MKKVFSIVLFLTLLVTSAPFAQVEVSTRLQHAIELSKPDDYIRALVLLRDQVDVQSLDQRLYEENATIQRRAYEVITALQEKANNTQGSMKRYLDELSETGDVFSYQAFWISNMFMVEAKPHVLNNLTMRMDIAEMDLDALLELDRPVLVEDAPESIESVEPGIRIINAHLLWAMGITGQGRLVMGIDTGVHLNHPALSHKWRGNHVPHNHAWFDPNTGSPTPTDCDGHGSHTVGTMVGRSLTTADTVGVAIDAEWIAAKTICSSPHTSNSIAAFQWAMDPDGNPATTNDMPDAISCSWWDPNISNECTSIYKTTLDAVEAAGIAVVFSAGNSGPNASTITRPKNINTNEVNIFATGAIDGAQWIGGNNNPIASFSSRGPSTCGGTGSLLIKPEVVAPGVSVRSSGTSTGYNSLSGTSMAAPHVAGAVALLKQFAPNMTGKQILEALYYTARDLGAAGEDNTYGRGLIDVYAAFLTLGTPDTIPPDPITDLAIINPTSNSLTLQWTVPFDSSMNGVTGYDIRMSTSPIPDTTAFFNATQIQFVGAPDTIGATETFMVTGLDFNTNYYFSIRSRDVWGNWSDLSNNPSLSTWIAPQISVNPLSITHLLNPNMIIVDTITVSNVTANPSTLDFTVSLENNTFPPDMFTSRVIPRSEPSTESTGSEDLKDNPEEIYGVAIDGMGGPDLFGYKWIDSDEPNGPQYVWEDIVSTGTLVTNWTPTGTWDPKDEGYAGPIPIGFSFKFYGNPKTQLYISSNGKITFAPLTANTFTNQSIPNPGHPNDFIAPFWDDLDGRNQGTVHYKQDGNRFIVQFTNWQRYPTTGSLTFQTVLYQSGKILVYYNNMNATLNSATVGIENAQGNDGLQVVFNAAYVQNNKALQFAAEPDWLGANVTSGTIYNGNSIDIELTFRSEDFPLGDYSMDVVISSNDPINPEVIVPVHMTVPIPVELSALSAVTDRNNVTIKWTTATETNNQGFGIERTVSGSSNWSEVSFVSGKGNSTEIVNYSYTDKALAVGKYQYRLKQIDFDGAFTYTQPVEVDITTPKDFALYQNYPNPFNPATTIEYSLPEKADVVISIYTALGELVTTLVNNAVDAGYHKATFDASRFTSGTYIYQIRAVSGGSNFVDTKKMMLIK